MSPRRGPQVYWRAFGQGPGLVLLNGWSASGLAWPRTWVRQLEQRFRVIRVDNRGSGYSRFADTPFTVADMADDVAAVLEAAEVERATVLGLSMGGIVAQELAMRHPASVAGLVLVATRPPAPAYAAQRESAALLGLVRPKGRDETLDAYFTQVWSTAVADGFADREPESMAELVGQIVARPTSRAMLVHQLRAVSGWGHAARLATVRAPAVVVHGTEDRMLAVENARRLADLIPGAHLALLPGVGHLPPVEAADRLTAAIDEVTRRGGQASGAASPSAA